MQLVYKRFWIVGAGAIGSVLAAVLSLKQAKGVCLVGESPHAGEIRDKGLTFETDGEPGQTTLPVSVLSPRDLTMLSAEDLVLLTQKVPMLEDTIRWLKPICHKDTGIVALQNGMGFEEGLTAALGRSVDRGLAFFGANCAQPGKVKYFPGFLRLRKSAVTKTLADVLSGSPLTCEISEDFNKVQWLKLAINCVANPLAGILRIANNRIVDSRLDPVKEAILAEVREVARAEGAKIKMTAADINRILQQDNIPSMLADLERGWKTEVDFINGAVVSYAAKHEIAVPVNSLLVAMVKFLEGKTVSE